MKSKPNEHKPIVSTTNQANQTDISIQSAMSKNTIDLDDDNCRQSEAMKSEYFVECTESQQTIWRLFPSLDCLDCGQMYNNKERKPFIICANNHLLCKSCYSKARQLSFNCPFCNIRMNIKNTSSHESIQLFLKIYNEIFQKQKYLIEQKRKRTFLEFQIPKNLRTLIVLMLIIVTPWIFDALKFIVCWIIDLEYRLVIFFYEQISEACYVARVIVEDEFYFYLYSNENGDYVYQGEDFVNQALHDDKLRSNLCQNCTSIYTQKHRAKLDLFMKILYIAGYFWSKIYRVLSFFYETLRVLNYIAHFIILLVGVVQFPFLIPIILVRLEVFIPERFRYKVGLYIDILEPEDSTSYEIDIEDIEKLGKFQLYFLLLIRNYMKFVLKLYKSIEVDMKKRCQELEYKKRMRLLKKNQKETPNPGKNTKSSSGTGSKFKFTF